MDGITAWILSQAYTKATAEQFGAVKGAPCTIAGTRKDASGNTVFTLSWKNDAGVVKTTDITVTRGADGVSITKVEVNEENHLVVTYSDGSELDAGLINTTEGLDEDLTATVAIGTVTSGKKYVKGTSLESIIRDILIKVEAPAVVLTLDPSKTVYDVVSETITGITLKANVTKKTYDVKKLSFYLDDVLIESRDITSGGMNNFAYTPATPIKKTSVFKAVVSDVENNSSNSSVKVSFVGKTYYGYVEPTIGEPTEAQIKALQNFTLKTVKGFAYEGITFDYNKIVYVYPKEFGALTSIKDLENNINYTNSFTKTEIKVDDIDYYCYIQNNASKLSGFLTICQQHTDIQESPEIKHT